MIVINQVTGSLDWFPDVEAEPPVPTGLPGQYWNGQKSFVQIDYAQLANAPIITGTGAPAGNVVASPGRIYAQSDALAGSVLWGKASGAGSTGWLPLVDIASAQTLTNKSIDFSQNAASNIPFSAITGVEGSTVVLDDPGTDSLLFWDDSEGAFDWVSGVVMSFIDGISGTNIVDSRTKRGILKEIYLAARTDGKAGAGTAENPFDCGIGPGENQNDAAAKFDAIMASLGTYVHIHLGAGTFYTVMIPKAWGIKEGWTIEGRGEATEIKGIGSLSAGTYNGVMGTTSIYYPSASRACIKNLRINCNWPELATTAPIGLGGYVAIGGTTANGSPNVWFAYTIVPTGVNPTEHDTITVGSTTGFPNGPATIYIQHSDGFMPITYQSKTSNTFVNCTGHSGPIPAGAYVSTVKLLLNEQFARTLTGTGVGSGRTVLRIPTATLQPLAAAIASGSNGAVLPAGTINLDDASAWPSSGSLTILFGQGSSSTIVNYGGKTGNQLTTCTGGSGTLSTGLSVFYGSSLPQSTLYVDSTTDFASAGLLFIKNKAGVFQVVKYTGKTSTTFTGCTGGTGDLEPDAVIYSPHQMVMSANATAPGLVDITFGGERNISLGAVTLQGTKCVLDGVHAINPYGSGANNKESFCLGVATTVREAPHYEDRNGDFSEMRYCTVESVYGTYGNPYLAAGGPFKIHDCYAFGVDNGFPPVFTSGGVNMANVKQGEVYSNTFVDCASIAYIDTGYCNGLKVYNNTLIRGSAAIAVVNQLANYNIELYGNTIRLQNRTFGGHSYGIILSNGTYTNSSVRDNRITFDSGTGFGYNHFRNFSFANWTGGTVYNNVLAAGTDSDAPSSMTNVRFANNRKADGTAEATFQNNAQGATEGGTGLTTYTFGDILYSSATDALAKLAGNTLATRKFLNQAGNGTISAAPRWDVLDWTYVLQRAGSNWAMGDLPYGATGAATYLPGNTTTTKKFLSQTGNGSVSAAPAWGQPAFTDITGRTTSAQLPLGAQLRNSSGSAITFDADAQTFYNVTIDWTFNKPGTESNFFIAPGTDGLQLETDGDNVFIVDTAGNMEIGSSGLASSPTVKLFNEDGFYASLSAVNVTANRTILCPNANGTLVVSTSAPATAGATGVQGQVAYDSTHFYVCISTNTWVRATLATW